jgi:hypothetical protein
MEDGRIESTLGLFEHEVAAPSGSRIRRALWPLCERARRDNIGMVIRNRRYFQWRYADRPDSKYSPFGVERGSELAGILVARNTIRKGAGHNMFPSAARKDLLPACVPAITGFDQFVEILIRHFFNLEVFARFDSEVTGLAGYEEVFERRQFRKGHPGWQLLMAQAPYG